jgi:nucleolar protein 15
MPTSSAKRDLEAKLSILNGAEWDSSDDEEPAAAAAESGKPAVNKYAKGKSSKKGTKKAAAAAAAAEKEGPASKVVYLGHIPTNFQEPELRGFLGQFGQVTRIKLSRSRKTANPRGFGFVEFDDPDVAEVVADTMSGYLMGEKRMVCHIVPQDKIRPDMFKGSHRSFKKVDFAALHRKKVNERKSGKKMKTITQRLVTRERKKRDQLKKSGIDYEFPGYEESNKAFPQK